MWLSSFTASVTTLIATLLGLPTAYVLSPFRFRGRMAAGVLLDAVLVRFHPRTRPVDSSLDMAENLGGGATP